MTDERAEAFRGRVTKWELKSVFADGKDVSDPRESWRIGTDPASLTLTLSLIDDENNNAASVLCFHKRRVIKVGGT